MVRSGWRDVAAMDQRFGVGGFGVGAASLAGREMIAPVFAVLAVSCGVFAGNFSGPEIAGGFADVQKPAFSQVLSLSQQCRTLSVVKLQHPNPTPLGATHD